MLECFEIVPEHDFKAAELLLRELFRGVCGGLAYETREQLVLLAGQLRGIDVQVVYQQDPQGAGQGAALRHRQQLVRASQEDIHR